MEVIAFYGPPGTGKSDRALVIAYQNKAPCIIDDGILIYHNRIVAGKSAKREESRLKAVRRALFWDEAQREDVKRQLSIIQPKRILILGTSDRMVNKIAQALELPAPSKYIRIEDVAAPDDIAKASEARNKEGKHVIPVPTMELRPYFKGYLVDSLRFWHRFTKDDGKKPKAKERSVVRPVFSYYGRLTFSARVIEALVRYAVKDVRRARVYNIASRKSRTQVNGLVLTMDLSLRRGTPRDIKKSVHDIRDKIQKELAYTTGMSLESIRINVITGVKR
ncbi:MAG: hypothetical protein SPI25_05770 [Dialister sp.]|nr:hypothetical protein [Dialister sp.]